MKKIKRAIIAVVCIGTLATMSTGVFADEFDTLLKGHNQHGITIGDSKDVEIGDSNSAEIGDSDDVHIGDSDSNTDNHHKNHKHNDFKDKDWQGCISFDHKFGNYKLNDKQNAELKDTALALMDAYTETESYVADGSETWWLKNKKQLSVRISNDEETYTIKFNPIYEEKTVTSCYMYIVNDSNEITEGYFITAEEYQNLYQLLNKHFLKDNVVAVKNNIKDIEELTTFIEDTYENQEDYFYDVDGNGKVSSSDLLKDKKYLIGIGDDLGNYDCTNDGNCNTADLLKLKKKLLGFM